MFVSGADLQTSGTATLPGAVRHANQPVLPLEKQFLNAFLLGRLVTNDLNNGAPTDTSGMSNGQKPQRQRLIELSLQLAQLV